MEHKHYFRFKLDCATEEKQNTYKGNRKRRGIPTYVPMTRVSDFRSPAKSGKIRNSSSSYLQQETNLIKHVEGEILDILNAASTISVLFMRERNHAARRSWLHTPSKSYFNYGYVY